jgi:hypothetical protein
MKVIRGTLFAFIIILFQAGSAAAILKDTLVIAQEAEPTTSDPQKRGERHTRNVCLNIFGKRPCGR